MVRSMSTLQVVEEILRAERRAMVVREIVTVAAGRLPTKSRTPDTVVARDLSMDLIRHPQATKFARVAPGQYALREYVDSGVVRPSVPVAAAPAPEPVPAPQAESALATASPLPARRATTSPPTSDSQSHEGTL
jgi:hypothetical protein